MHRRDLLKLGTLAGAAGLASTVAAPFGAGALTDALSRGVTPWKTRRVQNVIFLAYDGTGYEDLATVDFFAREVLGRRLRIHDLLAGGAAGVMVPSSLSAWVTDSAAATCAWSTGRKLVNGQLGQYPDGTGLTSILELAGGRGMKTGLVTSARITHATPAGWVARVPDRNMEDLIAQQYPASGTDILLGGGQGHFDPAVRPDGLDLYAAFREAGYDVALTAEELAASTGSRLLGTFTPGEQHLPYEVDRRFQDHPAPSLAELTRAALARLDGAEGGFVLQVEAGRIDHANHNNDPGGMAWDWVAADEALEVLLRYVDARDDTLLLFACDHDTGGGVTFGWGPGYRNADPALHALGKLRASHEWLLREVLPQNPSPAETGEVIREYLGIPVRPDEAALLSRVLSGDREGMRWGHRNAVGNGRMLQMAQLLTMSPSGDPDRPGISFATGNHTAGFVPAVIYGAGTQQRNLGIVDNTEFFTVMTTALGLDHENPIMTAEEARAIEEAS
jgi:alkaline phosphatase